MSEKHLYSYTGPVTSFGKVISNKWNAQTYAVSSKKAKSNLEYRFKSENNRLPGAKIELPGKIILISWGAYERRIKKCVEF